MPADEKSRRPPRHIPAPKRRQPAPPAAFAWRWLFPLAIAVLGVVVYFVALSGTRSVLDSSGGLAVEPVLDPAAPGYEVLVEPTRVMLLAFTDEDGALTGVTLLVPASGEPGGTAVTVPPGLVIVDAEEGPFRLDDRFEDGGMEALESALTALMQVGVTERQVLDPAAFEVFVEPAGPLELRLPDPLVEVDEDGEETVLFERGTVRLDAEDVPVVFGHLNPGEAAANRLARQVALWNAWFDALGDGGSVPDLDVPLTGMLASMGQGTVVEHRLPFHLETVPTANGPVPMLVADVAAARELALTVVPFPSSGPGAPRVPVRLLNGTASLPLDRVVTEFGPPLMEAGARLAVIGNAEPMNRAASSVRYQPGREADGRALARALGIDDVQEDDSGPSVADVTVIVGEDLVDGS